MEIEELNITQVILLVLLVSFVTSIATGIVTVSLLAQAPPAVTQTVNRVVERTVETIVPKETGAVITKETTVVVKEEDLITDSISSSLAKTARVFEGTSTSSPVVGLAALIGANLFVTDSSVVAKDHLIALGNSMSVFTVIDEYPAVGLAVLVPKATSTIVGAPFKSTDTDSLKLGQTVVALISVVNERVHIGSVSTKSYLTDVKRSDGVAVSTRIIETNIDSSLVPGTPLVNIFGDLVGISTFATGSGGFLSASDVATLLAAPKATSSASAQIPETTAQY